MKHENQRPQWIDQARVLLDESARDLDAATLSRLNRARQAAMRQGRRRPRALATLLPATALAAACALLVAVAVWRLPHHPDASPVVESSAAAEDGDADPAADDSLDLYQNLEFYAWLDAQERDGDG